MSREMKLKTRLKEMIGLGRGQIGFDHLGAKAGHCAI